jgi:hypothetical protein
MLNCIKNLLGKNTKEEAVPTPKKVPKLVNFYSYTIKYANGTTEDVYGTRASMDLAKIVIYNEIDCPDPNESVFYSHPSCVLSVITTFLDTVELPKELV